MTRRLELRTALSDFSAGNGPVDVDPPSAEGARPGWAQTIIPSINR